MKLNNKNSHSHGNKCHSNNSHGNRKCPIISSYSHYIVQSCSVSGGKYINESSLNQTLLDIGKNITDIPEVNMTCHQDFINTGDWCEPSCVDTFAHSEIGYLYILIDVCSGLVALSCLLGGSACIVIAIIGRKYV